MGKFLDLINGTKPVLVDFYADWCSPCKALAPVIKSVNAEVGDEVKIIKVDIDKNQAAATQYNIKGVPTLVLFYKGKEVWRHSGFISQTELTNYLQQKSKELCN